MKLIVVLPPNRSGANTNPKAEEAPKINVDAWISHCNEYFRPPWLHLLLARGSFMTSVFFGFLFPFHVLTVTSSSGFLLPQFCSLIDFLILLFCSRFHSSLPKSHCGSPKRDVIAWKCSTPQIKMRTSKETVCLSLRRNSKQIPKSSSLVFPTRTTKIRVNPWLSMLSMWMRLFKNAPYFRPVFKRNRSKIALILPVLYIIKSWFL